LPHPWVDTGVGALEDAAVLRPDGVSSSLVFTVDFITPIVDDPETFGAIAAANSISDVYAMGGEPQAALAICGFPSDRLPPSVLERIFRGGRDKAAEAGCAIVGGHTVKDSELKYGLCVIGVVDPKRILKQTQARAGDALVLTKPLGFGITAQAIKEQRVSEPHLAQAVALMTTLNKGAKDAALAAGARAATDITGFGLLTHLHNMLVSSRVAARVTLDAVPVLDFVPELARAGLVPGGTKSNLAYVRPFCDWGAKVSDIQQIILADAQTSGGLLISVPKANVDLLLRELEARRAPARAVIGEVVAGEPGRIKVL
jgi:selenide,water dikinase